MPESHNKRRDDQGWRQHFPLIVTVGLFMANILIVLIGVIYNLSYQTLQSSINDVKVTLVKSIEVQDGKVEKNSNKLETLIQKYSYVRYQCCSEIKNSNNDGGT